MSTTPKTLTGYVPALITQRLAANPTLIIEPKAQDLSAAILHIRLTGLIELAEAIVNEGPAGSDELTDRLKATFQALLDLLTGHGGDVIHLSGSVFIAIWPTSVILGHDEDEDLATMTQRAAQCGLALIEKFHQFQLATDLRLAIKATVATGHIATTDLGGVYGRWEFLVTGEALVQAAHSQQHLQPGQVALSASAWPLIQERSVGEPLSNDLIQLKAINKPIPPAAPNVPSLSSQAEAAMRGYLSGALLSLVGSKQSRLRAELLPITVLYIKLPTVNYTTPVSETQKIVRALQTILYDYEGSVDKISMDNQGAYLVTALGLPPLAHKEEGITLGLQAALAMQEELCQLNQSGTIGITTGRAFCGIVGNEQRSDYAIVGEIVHRARTLAEMNIQDPIESCQEVSIVCDQATYEAAQGQFEFERMASSDEEEANSVPLYRPTASLLPTEPEMPYSDQWLDSDLLDDTNLFHSDS